MNTKPQPDIKEIERAIEILHPAEVVVELRAFHKKRKRTDAGYYDGDNREAMAKEAARLNGQCAVYVTLNPVDKQLISRYANRTEEYADATTTDNNIISRCWLLVDVDPVRPKNTPATDDQLSQAKATARAIFSHLRQTGWSDPVTADSGNGVHLLYRIDLPNDDASRDLIKGVLQTLAKQFDTPTISVDQSVFNAGRIVKLYGTVANKGDHTDIAPHRQSRITYVSDNIDIVTLEQLQALVPPVQVQPPRQQQSPVTSSFDFDAFMGRLGIGYQQDHHGGRERYKLEYCPFNSDHGRGESAIFRGADGVLGFKCQHNSCADKSWRDVRTLIDGDAPTGRTGSVQSNLLAVLAVPAEPISEPIPLPDDLLPVEPFDYALLPAAVRPWVRDICERLQCPPDFVAVAVMAALGSLIGRTIGIRPQNKTDWIVIANMWALVVGRPGVMKSPAIEQALAAIKSLAAQALELYQEQLALYESTKVATELRKDAAKGKVKEALKKNPNADISDMLNVDVPEEPILKRYTANDTSAASLGELLRLNPNGLLVFRDELVSLLKSLDREDQAEGRGFYLTGWNGDSSYTIDRIGRGLNLHIPAVCISLLGGTQPGKIAEYVYQATQGGASDDGLLQRFGLLVWPDVEREWLNVDRWPDKEAKNQAFAVFKRLANLDPADVDAEQDVDFNGDPDGIPYLRLSPEALELFVEWRTELEHRLRSDDLHPALESHFSKYRKLIPGLALIIHLADGGTGNVSKDATLQALAWSDYLELHARRVYGSVTNRSASTAKEILKRITKGDLIAPFSSRDVWRPGWSKLSDRKAVQQALEMLVDYQWLVEEVRETGGRPATMYHLNQRAAA